MNVAYIKTFLGVELVKLGAQTPTAHRDHSNAAPGSVAFHEYFMDSESDNIENALKEFDGDYDIDELRLMRIKFISEVAN